MATPSPNMVRLLLKGASSTLQRKFPYVLEAYEGFPWEWVDAQAKTQLPSLDFSRLLEGLKQLRAGHAKGSQQLGNYLAEWLWKSPDSQEDPTTASLPTWPFNPVGVYLQQCRDSQAANEPLSVWLTIDVELQSAMEFRDFLPFECLARNHFLPVRIIRGGTQESASKAKATSVTATMAVSDVLRVLLVYANPDVNHAPPGSTYPHVVDLQKSFHHMLHTLAPLAGRGEIYIEQRENPTPEGLQDALRTFNPHIFLFLGHGYGAGDGGLICIDHGVPASLPIPQLAETLQHIPDSALRLMVLMACQSFGAASRFMNAGLPACVAMQPLVRLNFPAESVAAFAEPFFQQLVQFAPITQAYRTGVETLENSSIPLAAWMPTLWLASPADQLFEEEEVRFQQHYIDALLGKPEVGLIPVMGHEKGVPFQEVYIPQQLQTYSGEIQQSGEQEPQTLWEHLNQTPRLQVVAPIWMGKRTLCQWAAHQCMAQHKVLPIYVRRQDWLNPEHTFEEFLEQGYTDWLGWGTRRVLTNQPNGLVKSHRLGSWLYEKWQKGQALLILEPRPKADLIQLLHKLNSELSPGGQGSRKPQILWGTEQVITSPAIPECGQVTLREWTTTQHDQLRQQVAVALGRPHKAERLRQSLRPEDWPIQPHTLTRPGYLMLQTTTFLTDGDLLQEEGELLNRVVTHRLAITGRIQKPLEPDEPHYKAQILENLAVHSGWCQPGKTRTQEDSLAVIRQAMEAVKAGDISIYEPTTASQALEDLTHNSGFLQIDDHHNIVIEAGPWTKYFIARFITHKLFQEDKDIVQWINQKEGTSPSAMACPVCFQPLPPWLSVMAGENREKLAEAIKGIEEEEAPPYARVDPWAPKFKTPRRLLNVVMAALHLPQPKNG
ncbi:MAG: CHAT domain-containing protein [Nitrospira sp.]|nr:CHAT domain-containing protein [Nitrospira sp.]